MSFRAFGVFRRLGPETFDSVLVRCAPRDECDRLAKDPQAFQWLNNMLGPEKFLAEMNPVDWAELNFTGPTEVESRPAQLVLEGESQVTGRLE